MSATAFQRMRREQEEKKINETVAEARVKKIEDMTIGELKSYANEHSIDIGKAATAEGILKKIKGCGASE